jgi:hypothetical protein
MLVFDYSGVLKCKYFPFRSVVALITTIKFIGLVIASIRLKPAGLRILNRADIPPQRKTERRRKLEAPPA